VQGVSVGTLKLLYVPLTHESLEELRRRASLERRRVQDEAALVIERALLKSRSAEPKPTDAGREVAE
jgi:hypothetical protein